MKNSKKFCLMSMIFAFGFIALFTSDITAQNRKSPTASTFAKKAMTKLTLDFSFQIITDNCYAGGKSLTIKIDKPQEYVYLWEINVSHGGHQMNQDCICGEYAKVRVMRLKDGKQVTRVIKLPACRDENQ